VFATVASPIDADDVVLPPSLDNATRAKVART
jgi:hypothetical protein